MANKYKDRFESTLESLRSTDQPQVMPDVEVLAQSGAKSTDDLIRLAAQGPKRIRGTAIWALGKVGGPKAASILLKILRDRKSDAELRKQAGISLAEAGNKRTARSLIKDLHSSDEIGREFAAYVLGWLRDCRAVEPLLITLNNRSEIPRIRAQASEALGYLGSHDAVSALISSLQDANPEVRFWSVFALGRIADRRALSALRHVASTDDMVVPGWWSISQEAADALRRITQASQDSQQ